MPTVPYFLQLRVVLGASGTGTLTHTVPRGETLTLKQIRFNSTGAFDITDLRDSSGNSYTNASSTNGIPSAVLQDGANANIGIAMLEPELEIPGSSTIYIDLLDTSGAGNTVEVTFQGTRQF